MNLRPGWRSRSALPGILRFPALVLAIAACLLMMVLGFLTKDGSRPTSFDNEVKSAVDGAPGSRSAALGIDYLGEPIGSAVVAGVLVLLCVVSGELRLAIAAVVGTSLTVGVGIVLKHVFDRTIHEDESLCYPSGHTAFTTCVGLVLGLLAAALLESDRRRGLLLMAGGAMIGGGAMAWAQTWLDGHYPTDTVGGFCIAIAVVPPTAWLVDAVVDQIRSPIRSDRRSDPVT